MTKDELEEFPCLIRLVIMPNYGFRTGMVVTDSFDEMDDELKLALLEAWQTGIEDFIDKIKAGETNILVRPKDTIIH